MRTHDFWGNITVKGNTITLDCDEEKAKGKDSDGIGSALTFLREWDGKPLTLTSRLVRSWRPEPWAHTLWLPARESVEASPHPMPYIRPHLAGCEFGYIPDGEPDHQKIIATLEDCSQPREWHFLRWEDGAIHYWHTLLQRSISLTAPVCELGFYAEGCVVEVTVE